MATLRRIVSAGLQARAQAGIKVRQPLPEFNLQENPSFDFIKEPGWRDLLAGEVNVQKVHVGENIHVGEYVRVEITPGVSGQLATALDEGLMHQGIIRDLIRHVQELRKRAGLTVQDTIELAITTDDLAVQEAVRQCEQLLLAETRAKKLAKTLSRVEGTEQVTIHGHPVTLGLRRV
jgi:isoleucyl-tRNA synthetase